MELEYLRQRKDFVSRKEPPPRFKGEIWRHANLQVCANLQEVYANNEMIQGETTVHDNRQCYACEQMVTLPSFAEFDRHHKEDGSYSNDYLITWRGLSMKRLRKKFRDTKITSILDSRPYWFHKEKKSQGWKKEIFESSWKE